MKRFEMGVPKRRTEKPPIRVNLVEEKAWEPWDMAGELSERVSDLAGEHYAWIIKDENECDGLVIDVLGDHYWPTQRKGPRDWSPRESRDFRINRDGVLAVCAALKRGTEDLEGLEIMIRDTMQYMFEDAMIPDDQGIHHEIWDARREVWAKKNVLEDWIWEPLLEKGLMERSILIDLMNHVSYSREQGYYDRYIDFDFWNASLTNDLLHAWPKEDRKDIEKALEGEFRNIIRQFLSIFFMNLKSMMDQSDPSNRTEWDKHWKAMLKDEARVQNARSEIRAYLKKAPPVEETSDE